MILIVDDDSVTRKLIQVLLEKEGFRVDSADTGRGALDKLAGEDPELVISDIRMAEMSGFELKEAYNERFPHRSTPFVFLSSLADSASIVKGLDMGADDYLVKPIVPDVLKAKVQAILRRRNVREKAIFEGDLRQMSFIDLLKFSEVKGLTGEVEIKSGKLQVRVPFQAGSMVIEETPETDDLLSRLCDLEQGTFAILSQPVDFRDMVLSTQSSEVPTEKISTPMVVTGKLSGVRVGRRLFQIQTEYVAQPEERIITVAILVGLTLVKRVTSPENSSDKSELEPLIQAQHASVESEVRDKLSREAQTKQPAAVSQKERFTRFFDEGFEKYRSGDYVGARTLWEAAQKIDPKNKTIQINLRILDSKLK